MAARKRLSARARQAKQEAERARLAAELFNDQVLRRELEEAFAAGLVVEWAEA